MTAALALGNAAVTVAVVPYVLTSRPLAMASPRIPAAAHLATLMGMALLPAGGVACAVAGTAARTGDPPGSIIGCGLAPLAAARGLAVATLAPLCWQAVRMAAAARRTELTGMALAGSRVHRLLDGCTVRVLPSTEPAASVVGVRHPTAVVTSGLSALLNPSEQQAVCAHEAAHVRFGHPRLLLGAVVARTYGFLPPVRRAWSRLRRDVEAVADEEAARLVGATSMLSALARVTLARSAGSGLPDGPWPPSTTLSPTTCGTD